jgi:hypothetical protein
MIHGIVDAQEPRGKSLVVEFHLHLETTGSPTQEMSDFVSRHYVKEYDEHHCACDLRSDHPDLRAPLRKLLPHLTHLQSSPAMIISVVRCACPDTTG